MRRTFLSLLASMILASSLHALTFAPPELEKVNWESRQLTTCEVNGDGLKDLAYIDGIERSIDLLLQKKSPTLEPSKPNSPTPPLTITRWSRERIQTEAPPSAFVFGDFSGSGKMELAYTSKKLGIVFMQRDADGHWTQTHRLPDVEVLAFTHVMWAGKLSKGNESAPDSLVVLTKGKLLVINNYQITASYGMLYENSGFLMLTDMNGDGRLDIVYDYEAPRGFATRLQDEHGRFDREVLQTYAVETEKNFAVRGDKVYFFGGNTPFVEERTLAANTLKPATEVYGGYADHAEGALLDIDGDGQTDFVLADTKGSELILYRKDAGHWGQPERFPSLKSVTAVAALSPAKGSKAESLALFSPEEHAIAVAGWDADNKRIAFPRLVELPDEPVGLVEVAGKAWALTRTDKEFFIQGLSATGAFGEKQKLEALKRVPDTTLTLQEKGGTLLMFICGRDSAIFYWMTDAGALMQVKPSEALARANFAGLDESKIGRGDLTGEGADSLIIAHKSTLRIFKFSQGQLSLADQVLSLNDNASLRLPFVCGGLLWAYDTKADNFLKFERSKTGDNLWRNVGQVDAPALEPLEIVPDVNSNWLVLGKRAFYTLNPSQPGVTLAPVRRWESVLKVDGFNWASMEDFAFEDSQTAVGHEVIEDSRATLDQEGNKAPATDKKTSTADKNLPENKPVVILYNQPKRLLEVVDFAETPKSLLNFEVYKQDMHYNGRTGEEIEPREIVAADVTGDGKTDLILLIHNKVLVYPQK